MAVDIEQQVGRVWNPEVRPLISEAWRCYGVGAFRGCIALTWAAVCTDLIDKLERLVDEGETASAARSLVESVVRARAEGLTREGVHAVQDVERTVVDVAQGLELLDTVTARELKRLRDDRNLSVHSSGRSHGEAYSPTAEYARAHLAAALEGVLTLPATQGRRVIEQFTEYVEDLAYVDSPSYIAHTFYDRVKPAARRNVIELAAKHALLGLAVPEPLDPKVIADRMAGCLHVFATRDRTAVRDVMLRIADRFSAADNDTLWHGVGRAGDLDIFWEALPAPTIDRFSHLIEALDLPTQEWEPGPPTLADVLSVVVSPDARSRIPALVTRFDELRTAARAAVMARRVDPFFLSYVPSVLAGAGSWRTAEALTAQAVLPYAPLLDLPTLDRTLQEWASNEQSRTATGMRGHAVELYRRSVHLRPGDRATWVQFLDAVRSREDKESLFRYTELEAVMNT